MKIFDNILSGPLSVWNFLRAMSRTQLIVTGVTSLLLLSTAASAAATVPLSRAGSPSETCATLCTDDVQVTCETHPTGDCAIPCEPEGSTCIPCTSEIVGTDSCMIPGAVTAPGCDLAPGCTNPNSSSTVWVAPDPGSTRTTFPVITPPAMITPVTQPKTPPVVTTPAITPITTPTTTPADPANTGTYPAPVVRVSEEADGVRVTWDAVNSSDFFAYVVVFSATNANPAYPNDSYYSSITDRNLTTCLIESRYIKGGDYYFSVTALYNGKEIAVAGNAVKATMPSLPTPPAQPEGTYPAVTVNALSYDGISMNVSWSKTSDTTGFVGYKVVAAIDDTTPTFPENGCAAFVSSADTTSTSYVINGTFLAGKSYSVTVIAVYSANGVEHNVPANVQTMQF